MKFKLGDKVKVRKGLVDGEYKGSLYVNGEMAQVAGKTLTIKVIRLAEERYTVKENNWDWNDEMLEAVNPIDPIIERLKAEREHARLRIAEIGEMISEGNLEQYQIDLLSIRSRALKTVSVTYAAQLNALYREISTEGHTPEPKPKKYYVKVLKAESYYYWKPNPYDAADLTVSTNTNSFSSDKQFTMNEIKKLGLEDCERVEVQDD